MVGAARCALISIIFISLVCERVLASDDFHLYAHVSMMLRGPIKHVVINGAAPEIDEFAEILREFKIILFDEVVPARYGILTVNEANNRGALWRLFEVNFFWHSIEQPDLNKINEIGCSRWAVVMDRSFKIEYERLAIGNA
jgi:hypothetical protein